MDRRRFLKYGAAAVAVAGSALAGYEFDRWRTTTISPSVSTTTVTEIQTVKETVTETERLASLYGRLFFDYNGNGKQDTGEPAVSGALLQLKDDTGKVIVETLTDSSGDYTLEDVRTGAYRLHVGADKKFRYMCRSREEFTAVDESYPLFLNKPITVNIGLMEGFLTSPMVPSAQYRVGRYYDWDPKIGHVEWWNGKSYAWTNIQGRGWDDSHTGTDFDTNEGEEVVAPAPGVVDFAGVGRNPESLEIDIQHDLRFRTSYNHLSKILVSFRQRVSRGEIIGRAGETGTFYPHLHFELYQLWSEGPVIFDPYRPTFAVVEDRSGCWAVRGDQKHWLRLSVDKNLNLLNYWTRYNDPQFPAK